MSVIRKRAESLELKMSQGLVLPKQPVSDEEFTGVRYFAMFKDCYQDNCILDNGKFVRPCLPVFYRGKQEQK